MNCHPLESYSSYLDGRSLSEAEVRALRDWINADESNALEFVELALLHASITDRLTLGRLLDDLASHRSGGVVTADVLAAAIRDIETNSPRVQLPPPLVEVDEERGASYVPAVVAVIVFVCLGLLAFWRTGPLLPQEPRMAERPVAPVKAPEAPAPPKVVARLEASFDARWASEHQPALREDLYQGAEFILTEGVAHFNMAGGASAVLEGPAVFSLTDAHEIKLASGKVAVRVGEGAEQFIVNTPTIEVVDLGTEFGVQALPGGEGQVAVFDGTIALAAKAKGERGKDQPANVLRRLDAGFEIKLDAAEDPAAAISAVQSIENERYFLRPDEVEVRHRALAGSQQDRRLAAHYQRRRIKGLLAYQGFDSASQGRELIQGFQPVPLYPAENAVINFSHRPRELADRLEVMGGPVFLLLNTSPAGPFGRAGCLTNTGRIGRAGAELWLAWSGRRLQRQNDEDGSAGVSLMFGERSDIDEPVFMGRTSGASEFLAVQSAWGGAPAPAGERITIDIDGDPRVAGVQPCTADDVDRRWVARIEFTDDRDRVSVWLDPNLADLPTAAPDAVLEVAGVEFDRIRMAANRDQEAWEFTEFAAALNPEALERLAQVGKYEAD